jgi:hypothetical protein
MKTCFGSRTELHAVNPAISANNIDVSGKRSAMGTDLNTLSSSSLSAVSPSSPSVCISPLSVDRALTFGRSLSANNRSRICEGNSDAIMPLERAASPMILSFRRRTKRSYMQKAAAMKRNTATTVKDDTRARWLLDSDLNLSEKYNVMVYTQWPGADTVSLFRYVSMGNV